MRTESLPCKLTPEEKTEVGSTLSERINELAALQEENKEARREAKAKENNLQAEIRDLAHKRRTGKEYREVEIEDRDNWPQRSIETYRMDTGERIHTRGMTRAEIFDRQQLKLKTEPAPQNTNKKKSLSRKALSKPSDKKGTSKKPPPKKSAKAKPKPSSKTATRTGGKNNVVPLSPNAKPVA